MKRVIAQIKAGWAWLWDHRTKTMGLLGTGFAYAYENQDKLGLFISAKYLGAVMAVIGVATFLIGMYNTFKLKRSAPAA